MTKNADDPKKLLLIQISAVCGVLCLCVPDREDRKGKPVLYKTISLCAALAVATPAYADDFFTVDSGASFDDTVFAVEMAITGKGLVIDSVNHIGAMLARTKEDVGGTKDLFAGAQVMSFCSAEVSRQVMETDPMNIQYCPYGIYVFQPSDDAAPVTIGYRAYSADSMRPVNDLLQQIVADALD